MVSLFFGAAKTFHLDFRRCYSFALKQFAVSLSTLNALTSQAGALTALEDVSLDRMFDA
jgi:hypothetical protein